MKKKLLFTILISLLALMGGATAVQADTNTNMPVTFYGDVTIDGQPAPVGTEVKVVGTGVNYPNITGSRNPLYVTQPGKYGGDSGPYLFVQGTMAPNTVLTFFVNGIDTGKSVLYQPGALPIKIDLSVTTPDEPASGGGGGGGGGGGSSAPEEDDGTSDISGEVTEQQLTLDFMGTESYFTVDGEGQLQQAITLSGSGGNVVFTINQGTIMRDESGNPLTSLTVEEADNPPAPPAGAGFLGLPLDFGPDGATFDPPITVYFSYDPSLLPEGVAEEDLAVAFYDSGTGQWVELPVSVDTQNNIISVTIEHFCCFSIMYQVAAPVETTAPASTAAVATTAPASTTPTSAAVTPTPAQTSTTAAVIDGENIESSSNLMWILVGVGVFVVVVLAVVVIRRARSL